MTTIYALSSGAPPAAIAVLRISGPAALAAAAALAGALPDDRRATLRGLRDPADGALLDRALLLVFRAPASATGEDLVELHLHGGRAVVVAVERALAGMVGLRAAEPGEFTRRALMNGRIDLTEAEGLGDLLTAETETQRRAALTVAEGGIRLRVEDWMRQVLEISAVVEAELDFSDEDDVPALHLAVVSARCTALATEIADLVDAPPVERLKDGIRIVLAGPPNSGKSTLLNTLADREAAIVSPIAGTTRDRIEAPVSRGGIAYLLIDTAGLREGAVDPIEAIGVERARKALTNADIVLWLGDDPPGDGRALWLHPRADQAERRNGQSGRLAVSAVTGEGIADLWNELARRAGTLLPAAGRIALNHRQRGLVIECRDNLAIAASLGDLLIVAEHLRLARGAIDRVAGRGDTDAMLDALFGDFCIGK